MAGSPIVGQSFEPNKHSLLASRGVKIVVHSLLLYMHVLTDSNHFKESHVNTATSAARLKKRKKYKEEENYPGVYEAYYVMVYIWAHYIFLIFRLEKVTEQNFDLHILLRDVTENVRKNRNHIEDSTSAA